MSKSRHASLITKEECETILFRHFRNNNFKLIKHTLRPLSDEVEGFLGEHLWLETLVENEEQVLNLKFFAKFQPNSDFMTEFCRQTSAFDNEICFYEELIPEFKKYYELFDEQIVPKYYFSKSNLVVLEDCTKLNFQVIDSPDVLPVPHIKLVLKGVAKLHAASIIYEERKSKELKRKYRLIDDYQQNLKESFFHKNKEHFGYKWHCASLITNLEIINRMVDKNINREKFKRKYTELAEKCFEIAHPSAKFRNVCCHADLWRNNIMFKYENDVPVEFKFLDFQLMKYAPPAYDILKFLYQVTSAETRKHYFDEFINLYYQQLCCELEMGKLNAQFILPFDEFQASIKYLLGYVKIEASYYFHFQRVGAEFLKQITSNLENFRKFVLGDRIVIVDKFYKQGTYFKKWMDEILLEIHDIITHDNFSTEDCQSVIKNKLNSTNYELIHYDIKDFNEKRGFLGYHRKIEAMISINNHQVLLKFFAKFLPETKFNDFAISSGAFDNEVFMYDTVFKTMNNLKIDIYDCVPKCFFTRRNDILVFNDLFESGFQTINKHNALNYKQVIVILSCIAKYHATSFIMEEKLSQVNKKPFRIVDEFASQLKDVAYVDNEDETAKTIIQALIKGFHAQIDMFPDATAKISDQDLKRKVDIIFNNLMYEQSKPSEKYRNVLCHGDLWSSNIMIKCNENGDPVRAKLVDFQCVKKCPPAQDLMAFIYLTTSRKFRSNYMNDVLRHYYQEMEKYLMEFNYSIEKILPYKEYVESCEYYKVFAISQAVSHFQLVMTPSDDMAMLFADNELLHKTFNVDRSEFIRRMCEKHPHYKLMLQESLKDFRVMCETVNIT